MKTAPEIKERFLQTLAEVLDESLGALGFTRMPKSLIYKRNLHDAEQRITFTIHCHPRYQPGADAHIYPSIQLLIPSISKVALALVNGNKILLGGTPEIIVAQPIDFTAPKDKYQRWFVARDEQFAITCKSIQGFLDEWVLPFLSEISTPADLIKLHETNDSRIVKSKEWHIFVAAAYEVLGLTKKAREVVREQFGSPGLRKLYAPLFASLAVE